MIRASITDNTTRRPVHVDRPLARRDFLRVSSAAMLAFGPVSSLAALTRCDAPAPQNDGGDGAAAGYSPAGTASSVSGPVREVRLGAEAAEVDLGPLGVHRRWVYNGALPGPELRVREGERLRVVAENRLPEETTIHWHGLPVPNDMDGVPGVTQDPVPTGGTFMYEFTAAPAGSYMYHAHVGLQLDRGLYGPLIVEESSPHVAYDREYTLLFDDFTPAEPRIITERGMGMMGGMPRGPEYEAFLVNGRPPADPPTLEVARGERIRLRLMNPGSQTTFHVALAGHKLLVTHTDGRPVQPVEVDSLLIGMGERYDVIVEANNPGAWNLIGAGLDAQPQAARAVVRYGESREARPSADQIPDGLRRGARLLELRDLHSVELDAAASGEPDRTFDLMLTGGGMMGSPRSSWSINRQAWPNADPLIIYHGERVRVRMTNHSPMRHPLHLHGFFFRVGNALKETVVVPPHMGQVAFEFNANNPGNWFFHCHDLYHMESGMARVFQYG